MVTWTPVSWFACRLCALYFICPASLTNVFLQEPQWTVKALPWIWVFQGNEPFLGEHINLDHCRREGFRNQEFRSRKDRRGVACTHVWVLRDGDVGGPPQRNSATHGPACCLSMWFPLENDLCWLWLRGRSAMKKAAFREIPLPFLSPKLTNINSFCAIFSPEKKNRNKNCIYLQLWIYLYKLLFSLHKGIIPGRRFLCTYFCTKLRSRCKCGCISCIFVLALW